jgi:hypothetical protein
LEVTVLLQGVGVIGGVDGTVASVKNSDSCCNQSVSSTGWDKMTILLLNNPKELSTSYERGPT